MNDKETVGTSKFLSLVLRHEPERVGSPPARDASTTIAIHAGRIVMEDFTRVICRNTGSCPRLNTPLPQYSSPWRRMGGLRQHRPTNTARAVPGGRPRRVRGNGA